MGQLEFTKTVVDGWARHRPDDDLFSLGAIQRIVWCGRLAGQILERSAAENGLRRHGDYEVLALLRRSEPNLLTPIEIAQQLMTSASGMTGRVDRLEVQGLLERQPDPVDRRAVRLALTESGRSLADSAFSVSLAIYDTIINGLPERDRRELDRILSSLLAHLDYLANQRRPWEQHGT